VALSLPIVALCLPIVALSLSSGFVYSVVVAVALFNISIKLFAYDELTLITFTLFLIFTIRD